MRSGVGGGEMVVFTVRAPFYSGGRRAAHGLGWHAIGPLKITRFVSNVIGSLKPIQLALLCQRGRNTPDMR
jgi:hypothetical protein